MKRVNNAKFGVICLSDKNTKFFIRSNGFLDYQINELKITTSIAGSFYSSVDGLKHSTTGLAFFDIESNISKYYIYGEEISPFEFMVNYCK